MVVYLTTAIAILCGVRIALGFGSTPLFATVVFTAITLSIVVAVLSVNTQSGPKPALYPLFFFGAVAGPLLLPWLASRVLPDPVWKFASFGLLGVVVIWAVGRILKRGTNFQTTRLGAGVGLVSAIVLLLWLVLGSPISPLTYESALYGVQHKDTMFHAAIAQMLGNHDVRAIGVNAYASVPYHVFSHKIIWGLSNLADTPVLQGYMLFVYLTGVPMMLVLTLRAGLATTSLFKGGTTFSALYCVLAVIFSISVLENRSFLASESYLVSLILFLVFLTLVIDALSDKNLQTKGLLSYGLVVIVLVWLASEAKVSTGAVMAPMAIVMFVILDKFSIRSLVVAPVVFGGIVMFVLQQSALGDSVSTNLLDPFHFSIRYPKLALPQWLFLILTCFAMWRVRHVVQANWPIFLVLGIGAAAGMTAANLFYIAAGSAYYFSGPGIWCAVLMMIGSIQAGAIPTRKWRLGITGFIALFFIVDVGKDVSKLQDTVQNLTRAQAAQGDTPVLLQLQQNVERLSGANTANTAVYIAGSARTYWDLTEITPRKNQCWAIAFYQPAITGLPSLAGLPSLDRNCETPVIYGLSVYLGAEAAEETPSDSALCKRAMENDISTILVFSDMSNGRRLECDGPD